MNNKKMLDFQTIAVDFDGTLCYSTMVQTYLMDDSSDSTAKFLKRFDKEWKRYNRDLIAKVQKYEEENAS